MLWSYLDCYVTPEQIYYVNEWEIALPYHTSYVWDLAKLTSSVFLWQAGKDLLHPQLLSFPRNSPNVGIEICVRILHWNLLNVQSRTPIVIERSKYFPFTNSRSQKRLHKFTYAAIYGTNTHNCQLRWIYCIPPVIILSLLSTTQIYTITS